MLDTLPPEIIEKIAGYLPSAACIASLARTNRRIYSIVSNDNYAVFRDFVHNAFPSITVPPFWREMACSLTSRARAWEKRALIARECCPTEQDPSGPRWLDLSSKFGFVPVIDSYDEYTGSTFGSKKEVLAFGAAGRLRLRTTLQGKSTWKSFCFEEDHLPQFDITDIRLLRPHQHVGQDTELILIGRANGDLELMQSTAANDQLTRSRKFRTNSARLGCIDVSEGVNPQLIVCNTRSMQLFPVHGEIEATQSGTVIALTPASSLKHKNKCAKFLTENTVAVSCQHIEGRECAPILIYDITRDRLATKPIDPAVQLSSSNDASASRHAANTINPLKDVASLAGRPGQVFLSGWTDGIVRMFDLRTPLQPIAKFVDHVDDGQVLSLAAFGHEKFFAGSHQNACLKMFDMRMPGQRRYSYVEIPQQQVQASIAQQALKRPSTRDNGLGLETPSARRGINIFLALTINRGGRLWQPLPRRQDERLPRYRGSVYSLASPSSSSPTLYAGIRNHVVQLDFASSDDLRLQRQSLCHSRVDSESLQADRVLDVSCYERPREGFEATDPVLLRKQVDWRETMQGIREANYGRAEPGWDERWRLSSNWKDKVEGRRWRRGTRA